MVRTGGRRRGTRKISRKYRGGTGNAPSPSSYSSAASYQEAVNGGTNAQYDRVFSQSSGNASSSNAIVGIQGQKAGARRSNRRRSKRGGFWGSIINQAIVPFSILGMQQSYRRKRHGGTKKL
jgi:hypothetical protein